MKINEIITETTLEEGIQIYPIVVTKQILLNMGFEFVRFGKGSHEIWGHSETGDRYTLAKDGKMTALGSAKDLVRIMKRYNYNPQ